MSVFFFVSRRAFHLCIMMSGAGLTEHAHGRRVQKREIGQSREDLE
jgi:hypothetical protein